MVTLLVCILEDLGSNPIEDSRRFRYYSAIIRGSNDVEATEILQY
jgi:hypothetical protein